MIKPTLNKAKQLIKKSNAGLVNLKASWSHKPTWCQKFNGEYYWSSVVNVSANGFRPKKMVFTSDYSGLEIS